VFYQRGKFEISQLTIPPKGVSDPRVAMSASGGSQRISRGTDADLAKRKAAELAALKLLRNK
jgi:hypothetical protein